MQFTGAAGPGTDGHLDDRHLAPPPVRSPVAAKRNHDTVGAAVSAVMAVMAVLGIAIHGQAAVFLADFAENAHDQTLPSHRGPKPETVQATILCLDLPRSVRTRVRARRGRAAEFEI